MKKIISILMVALSAVLLTAPTASAEQKDIYKVVDDATVSETDAGTDILPDEAEGETEEPKEEKSKRETEESKEELQEAAEKEETKEAAQTDGEEEKTVDMEDIRYLLIFVLLLLASILGAVMANGTMGVLK